MADCGWGLWLWCARRRRLWRRSQPAPRCVCAGAASATSTPASGSEPAETIAQISGIRLCGGKHRGPRNRPNFSFSMGREYVLRKAAERVVQTQPREFGGCVACGGHVPGSSLAPRGGASTCPAQTPQRQRPAQRIRPETKRHAHPSLFPSGCFPNSPPTS